MDSARATSACESGTFSSWPLARVARRVRWKEKQQIQRNCLTQCRGKKRAAELTLGIFDRAPVELRGLRCARRCPRGEHQLGLEDRSLAAEWAAGLEEHDLGRTRSRPSAQQGGRCAHGRVPSGPSTKKQLSMEQQTVSVSLGMRRTAMNEVLPLPVEPQTTIRTGPSWCSCTSRVICFADMPRFNASECQKAQRGTCCMCGLNRAIGPDAAMHGGELCQTKKSLLETSSSTRSTSTRSCIPYTVLCATASTCLRRGIVENRRPNKVFRGGRPMGCTRGAVIVNILVYVCAIIIAPERSRATEVR